MKPRSAAGHPRLLLTAIALASACAHLPPSSVHHDLVVYGGTSAAVIAAVQAKELGQSVLIVCPDAHLGGMTASGLGWTDQRGSINTGGGTILSTIGIHDERGTGSVDMAIGLGSIP